jgi:hypothetical protein
MTARFADFDHVVGRPVTGPVHGSEVDGVAATRTGIVLGYQFRPEILGTMFLVLLPDGSVVPMAAGRIRDLDWSRGGEAHAAGDA